MTSIKLMRLTAIGLCGAALLLGAPANAKLAGNKLAANGRSLNGTALSGRTVNAAAFDVQAVKIERLVLPGGATLNAR